MTPGGSSRLNFALATAFLAFVFASTFSIALAQFLLGVAAGVFLVFCVARRINPVPATVSRVGLIIGAFIGWQIIAALVGENRAESLWVVRDAWLFAAVPIGAMVLTRIESRIRFMTVLAVGVLLVSLYGVVQFFTGEIIFKSITAHPMPGGYGYRAQGAFSNALTYGNYMATASAFLLALGLHFQHEWPRWMRTLVLSAGSGAAVATLLSYSRGPIVGLILVLIALTFTLRIRQAVAVMTVVVAVGIAGLFLMPGMVDRFQDKTSLSEASQNQSGRLYIWKTTAGIIAEYPVFGTGPANFGPAYLKRVPPETPIERRFGHAHNDPLHFAATVGLPGAALFLAVWLILLWRFWRGFRGVDHPPEARIFCLAALAGSVMFFLSSLTEATFFDEEVRHLLMIVWAAGLYCWYATANRRRADG